MAEKIPSTLTQSQDDAELNRRIDKHFEEAKNYIDTRSEQWSVYEDFYDGRQWKRATRRPIENIVFQLIESEVPILTDSQPAADIVPLEEQHTQAAEVLSAAVKSEFRYNNMIIKWSQVIRNALKTGTGWFYVDWDPDLEKGMGHVVIRLLDWRNVFIDPLASDIEDSDFVGLKFPLRLEQVIRRFPDKEEKLKEQQGMAKADVFRQADTANDKEREKAWTGFQSGEMPRVNKLAIVQDLVDLEEAWLRDYSLEKIPEEVTVEEIEKENEKFKVLETPEARKWEDHAGHILGHTALLEDLYSQRRVAAAEALQVDPSEVTDEDIENLSEDPELGVVYENINLQIAIIEDHIKTHDIWGEQNPDGKRPKFPNNWRLVIRVGKLVLYDGVPPVDDGQVPLVPVYAYKNEDSVYGTGEIQNIIHQQKILNEMSFAELQSLRLNSNAGWVKDDNSGVKASELTNEQGIVITKKQGTEVTRLTPAPTSPQFQIKMQDQRRGANDIMGLQDASQGRRPAGVVSGDAIDSLKESNLTRIREKDRIITGYSAVRLGWLVAARIVKYWSNSRKLMLFDQNGELKRFDFDPENIEDLRYDVLVTEGSTAGMDPETIFLRNLRLLQLQIIDPVTFVEATPMPNKAHILKKVRENNDKTVLIQQLTQQNEELTALLEQAEQQMGEIEPQLQQVKP